MIVWHTRILRRVAHVPVVAMVGLVNLQEDDVCIAEGSSVNVRSRFHDADTGDQLCQLRMERFPAKQR